MAKGDVTYLLGSAAQGTEIKASELRVALAVQLTMEQAREVVAFLERRPTGPLSEHELGQLLLRVGAEGCIAGERKVRAAAKQDRSLHQAVRRLKRVVKLELSQRS